MFNLVPKPKFDRELKKLVKNNKLMYKKIQLALNRLQDDPQDSTLSSHKVNLSLFGEV